MKRVFLLTVVSGLLAMRGFAQTPDAGSTADQSNVTGCLGGSDGNYTVAEDGTRQIFKITTSSVDLKAHLGHDVKLIGHKASEAVSSGAADNSFAITELSMISDHCTVAAAAPAATASPSSETVIPPATAATTPAATASQSPETVSPPPADAAQPTRRAAHPRIRSIPATADTTTPAATASTPSETVSPPAAAATAPTVTHRSGSLFLLISVAVLMVALGTLVPLLGRWRKRKMLERTGTPNLSFTKEESSDRNEPEPRKVA
jgi:hypothetical protein